MRDGGDLRDKGAHSSSEGSSSGAETVRAPQLKRANAIRASDLERPEPSSMVYGGPKLYKPEELKSEHNRGNDGKFGTRNAKSTRGGGYLISDICCSILVSLACMAVTMCFLTLLVPLALCIVLGTDPFPRWIQFSLAASRAVLVLAYIGAILGSIIFVIVVLIFIFYLLETFRDRNAECVLYHAAWKILWNCSWTLVLMLFVAAFIGGPNLLPRAAKAGMWPRLCGGDNGWLAVEMSRGQATVSLRDGANWHEQFTYSITSTTPDVTTFQLLDYTTSDVRVAPALNVIDYATMSGEFVGRCEGDTGMACPTALNVTGSIYDVDSRLTFSITSNGTQHVLSRAYDKKWSFEDAPVLDLRALPNDSAGSSLNLKHAPVILRTSLHRCPRMKTCIPRSSVARTDNEVEVLGPEVLVPLGWVAMRAQEWGERCTGRSLSPYTIG